jgi:hypothetical protein
MKIINQTNIRNKSTAASAIPSKVDSVTDLDNAISFIEKRRQQSSDTFNYRSVKNTNIYYKNNNSEYLSL